MNKDPIIGIDLGTTNSCAAIVEDGGNVKLIPYKGGEYTIPSIFAIDDKGNELIGYEAKRQWQLNPKNTIYGAKRLVGRPFQSEIVAAMKQVVAYSMRPGKKNDVVLDVGKKEFSLQEVSAKILNKIRDVAANHLKTPIKRAVVTVPAYFNDRQRQTVKEAGKLIDLEVVRIINEPTAAALAYGAGKSVNKKVLVYDLGGGTFDVSIIEIRDRVFEVKATGGDVFLGGIDFDNAIVAYLLEEFHKQTGITFHGDRVAMQRLQDAAERAKCSLSERSELRVHVAFITMIDGKPYDLDVRLTREKLVQLTEELVNRTLQVCADVLDAKGLTPKDMDEIILVGGQSRSPLVHEKISWFFGKAPTKNVHPDEAVALGAALLAHSLGQVEGVLLIDVLPMAIGVGLPGGRFKPVLERNTALPAAKTYQLSTSRDDQSEIDLVILQGESERAVENEYLGTLKLTGLPPGPRGSVRVTVTFEVTNECILKVTAREGTSGAEVMSIFSTRDTPEQVKEKMGLHQPHPEIPAARPQAPGRTPSLSGMPAVTAPRPTAAPPVPLPVAIAATASEVAPGGLVGWLKRILGRN